MMMVEKGFLRCTIVQNAQNAVDEFLMSFLRIIFETY